MGEHNSNRANAESGMCEKCQAIDERIKHYTALSTRVTDKQTLDGIKNLIEGLEAQKKALHPD
jgi:hypothetical protein